jgi:hypothetical protein
MHRLAYSIVCLAALFALGEPAAAQTYNPRYPVCISVAETFGGVRIACRFASMAQCAATASGLGGTCSANPYWGWKRTGQ